MKQLILCLLVSLVSVLVCALNAPFREPGQSSGTKPIKVESPGHWLAEYIEKYPGPVSEVFIGAYLLPDKYMDLTYRLKTLDEFRRRVLERPHAWLNAHEKALLQRPFYNWLAQSFHMNHNSVYVGNPHDLNRLVIAFEQDAKTVNEVERLLFDLVTKGLID